MNLEAQHLRDISYGYFPRGLSDRDPTYDTTPEIRRQREARIVASAKYDEWRGLLRCISARFPTDQFPGVEVRNSSPHLQSATAAVHLDRAFSAAIVLPPRSPQETQHYLELAVSFVVPYYALRSVTHGPLRKPSGELNLDVEVTFTLSPDEQPYAAAIEEEIRRTFPEHERLPAELGMAIVPEVATVHKGFGEATVFNCLFVDSW